MSLKKQAKIISDAQIRAVLNHVSTSRYPLRDRVMVLLSVRAGMRAIEIASVTWGMVTDSEGVLLDAIALPNSASKGKSGGRIIPLHKELRLALADLQAQLGPDAGQDRPIIHSERAKGMTQGGVTVWFFRLYAALGFNGASSHSGRRTFITGAARKITAAGGSLRDVQDLAGHSSISTTQRYIEVSGEAKRRVIDSL